MMLMEKEYHYTEITDLPSGDVARIDVRWVIEKGKIRDFAINVSLFEDDKSVDVYRVDTKHGHLHEQRFWISPKPKALDLDYNTAFVKKKNEVIENFSRWAKLFINAKKRSGV